MQKLRNTIALCVSAAALLAAATVHAQFSVVPDPVQYIVAPETPEPADKVTISAQGVGGFLGGATITWTQNGTVALSGVGASTFTFTAGAIGSQTHIQVRIVSSTQGTFTHDFVFLPSLVNLVWEAETSVPPYYRGKALYSAGSKAKVVAFPVVLINGARVPASNLTLQWTLNDEPVADQSGLGRTTLSFTGNQLQTEENVAVTVYYGASKIAYGAVTIPATNPAILFYDKDALRGVLYDSAMPSAVSLTSKEITLQAVPYYFSNSSFKTGGLSYAWTLNGEDAVGPASAQGLLTLRQAGTGQGSATVGVSLQNTEPDKYVQAASTAIQLIFGHSSDTSLFGL